jgi:hypothetical protein
VYDELFHSSDEGLIKAIIRSKRGLVVAKENSSLRQKNNFKNAPTGDVRLLRYQYSCNGFIQHGIRTNLIQVR